MHSGALEKQGTFKLEEKIVDLPQMQRSDKMTNVSVVHVLEVRIVEKMPDIHQVHAAQVIVQIPEFQAVYKTAKELAEDSHVRAFYLRPATALNVSFVVGVDASTDEHMSRANLVQEFAAGRSHKCRERRRARKTDTER